MTEVVALDCREARFLAALGMTGGRLGKTGGRLGKTDGRFGRRAPRGVTLVEVLLVVSLIAFLALFTWPDFSAAARSERLEESARRLRSLVAMCRAEAMNDARRYRVTIRLDGSMKLRRQYDPLEAPHVFVPVSKDWARMEFLLEDVWVESVAPLPDGPPPILVEDELMEFEDMEEDFEPIPIEDFESPIVIDFEPDGTSDSLRWVLRAASGRGMQMTLDGRLGRVSVEYVERLEADAVERPPEIDLEAEADEEREAWDEVGWEPYKP